MMTDRHLMMERVATAMTLGRWASDAWLGVRSVQRREPLNQAARRALGQIAQALQAADDLRRTMSVLLPANYSLQAALLGELEVVTGRERELVTVTRSLQRGHAVSGLGLTRLERFLDQLQHWTSEVQNKAMRGCF